MRKDVIGREGGKTDRTVILPARQTMRLRLAEKGWANADTAVKVDLNAEEVAAMADAGATPVDDEQPEGTEVDPLINGRAEQEGGSEHPYLAELRSC